MPTARQLGQLTGLMCKQAVKPLPLKHQPSVGLPANMTAGTRNQDWRDSQMENLKPNYPTTPNQMQDVPAGDRSFDRGNILESYRTGPSQKPVDPIREKHKNIDYSQSYDAIMKQYREAGIGEIDPSPAATGKALPWEPQWANPTGASR